MRVKNSRIGELALMDIHVEPKLFYGLLKQPKKSKEKHAKKYEHKIVNVIMDGDDIMER